MAMHTHITPRRRPEDAAAFTLMLIKASVLPPAGSAAVVSTPRLPVLAGGAAAEREPV